MFVLDLTRKLGVMVLADNMFARSHHSMSFQCRAIACLRISCSLPLITLVGLLVIELGAANRLHYADRFGQTIF